MKYMFASDIHGSAYYCRKMLEAFEAEGASRLFLLGDLLYHGPRNDLPKEYAPKQVIAMLNEKKQYLTNVRGNCDAEFCEFAWILTYYTCCRLTSNSYSICRSHACKNYCKRSSH